MNINPFIILLANIISLYQFAFVIWIIMTWLIKFQIVNEYQILVRRVMDFFEKIFIPPMAFVRKYLPAIAGIDLSPLVLFLFLTFLKEFLFTYFYKI